MNGVGARWSRGPETEDQLPSPSYDYVRAAGLMPGTSASSTGPRSRHSSPPNSAPAGCRTAGQHPLRCRAAHPHGRHDPIQNLALVRLRRPAVANAELIGNLPSRGHIDLDLHIGQASRATRSNYLRHHHRPGVRTSWGHVAAFRIELIGLSCAGGIGRVRDAPLEPAHPGTV